MTTEERKAYRKEWRLKRIAEDPEYLIKRRVYINNRYAEKTGCEEKHTTLSPEERLEHRKQYRKNTKEQRKRHHEERKNDPVLLKSDRERRAASHRRYMLKHPEQQDKQHTRQKENYKNNSKDQSWKKERSIYYKRKRQDPKYKNDPIRIVKQIADREKRNSDPVFKAKQLAYQRKRYAESSEFREKQSQRLAKRYRNMDFIPLNKQFPNSNAHHIDDTYVIYIPVELHRKHTGHNHKKSVTMIKINVAAFQFMNPDCYLHLVENYTLSF